MSSTVSPHTSPARKPVSAASPYLPKYADRACRPYDLRTAQRTKRTPPPGSSPLPPATNLVLRDKRRSLGRKVLPGLSIGNRKASLRQSAYPTRPVSSQRNSPGSPRRSIHDRNDF